MAGHGPHIEPIEPPNEQREPIDVVLSPLRRFARYEAAGGLVLIAVTVIALVWSNSPAASSYTGLWNKTLVSIGVGSWGLEKPLVVWINDLLMSFFFLLVGLEIKRELLVGELRSPRKAVVPIAAAIGGMAVPGGLYALVNIGEPTMRGWGIPMATDIAFALGVLALLGSRVPVSLKIFLTTLAIIDDLGALAIIAIFYTENLKPEYLLYAAIVTALMAGLNLAGFRRFVVYQLVGAVLWYLILKSGVHATITGVVVAMIIPARTRVSGAHFLAYAQGTLDLFQKEGVKNRRAWTTPVQQSAALALEDASTKIQTPLRRFENMLLPISAFFIIPVFALSNAGVALDADIAGTVASPVYLGITLGLVLGKPIGVLLGTWLVVKSGLGALPTGASWPQILGIGFLSGIGFTMSLFIANLAFAQEQLDQSKLAILAASLIAGITGFIILRLSRSAQDAQSHE